MRARVELLRWRWRQISSRTRLGMAIAIVAIAGLIWQHDAAEVGRQPGAAAPVPARSVDAAAGAAGHAEETAAAPVTVTPTTPGSPPHGSRRTWLPNGNHDNWVARLTPDTKADLLAQYQSADIATVTQAAVTQVNGPMSTDPSVPTFRCPTGTAHASR